MPRAALSAAIFLVLVGAVASAAALDPHMDPAVVRGSCGSCHRGHGVSRSPMLPSPQAEVCLACHDTEAKRSQMVLKGLLDPSSRPAALSSALTKPFQHPISEQAYSRLEPGVVTCTSCHSPHRSASVRNAGPTSAPGKKQSQRDPMQFEHELCQECHGSQGVQSQSLNDISRLLNPNSRSYHPIEGPSAETSPSVLPALAGREINCTDCHGNDDPAGPKGIHGSGVRYLLASSYTTVDGQTESPAAYALCYRCHQREKVLDSPLFPEHRLHVVDEKATCTTCHNPHGSVGNRALIRFDEQTTIAAVGPSIQTNLLGFESSVPGSGACWLTCHGEDHAPQTYGVFSAPLRKPLPDGAKARRPKLNVDVEKRKPRKP